MVTREFVITELGPLDPLTCARILATGATAEDIVEARRWLEGDELIEREFGHPSGARVQTVIEIVRDVVGEDDEEGGDAIVADDPEAPARR
jgi:hypothetical protein